MMWLEAGGVNPYTKVIIRGNVYVSRTGGTIGTYTPGGIEIYKNTIHTNDSYNGNIAIQGPSESTSRTFNNIVSHGGTGPAFAANALSDYNCAYQSGGTPGANSITSDPLFVDGWTSFDMRLQSGSPCRGIAMPDTTANGNGSSSVNLVVVTSNPFWPGDPITVGGTSATISAVPSSTTITLSGAISWSNGDAVVWRGQTDLGAFPYGHTRLTAATYTTVGNAYTVTPNGDTRQVEFYENGIPQSMDTASPYTYTSSGGTVIARVYPLYASATLHVDATDAGEVYRVGRSGTVRAGTVRRP
jgi:hypothetical protein